MGEIPDNWRLALAGLYHDIGKGLGGHHEIIGAEKVTAFCRAFGLDDSTTDFIAFLVREHLTMSLTAQKRDISDPEVVRRFADVVKTKTRLDALYLLTVADIRATSPKVWSPWKAQLLETLYHSTLAMLQGEDTAVSDRTHAGRTQDPSAQKFSATRFLIRSERPSGASSTSSTSCATRPRKSPGTLHRSPSACTRQNPSSKSEEASAWAAS